MNPRPNESPITIADFLFNRRDSILNQWRIRCESDDKLSHVVSLDRNEFNDHLPMILDVLSKRLQKKEPDENPTLLANFHGLHRWRLGRSLGDVLLELDYLYEVILNEVQVFWKSYKGNDPSGILEATQVITRLKSETVQGSLTEYMIQQQISAASRSAGLQQALNDLNILGKNRSEILKASSHDLKSSFGVIKGVTTLLNKEGKSEEERSELVQMLDRNLTNLQDVLVQLTDLARLEAGQEELKITEYDGSEVLSEVFQGLEPMASEKGILFLKDGPASLPVQGDRVKTKRIVQNLLVNALRYTRRGVVSLSWSHEEKYRWYISIQDSGPGLPANISALIAGQLKPAVEQTAVMEPDMESGPDLPPVSQPEEPEYHQETGGEGLGLHIIKHLCELMSGSLAVESVSGKGTLITIRLPMRYQT